MPHQTKLTKHDSDSETDSETNFRSKYAKGHDSDTDNDGDVEGFLLRSPVSPSYGATASSSTPSAASHTPATPTYTSALDYHLKNPAPVRDRRPDETGLLYGTETTFSENDLKRIEPEKKSARSHFWHAGQGPNANKGETVKPFLTFVR